MEKNVKKNVYTCITEALCCIPENTMTLQIDYLNYLNVNLKKKPETLD